MSAGWVDIFLLTDLIAKIEEAIFLPRWLIWKLHFNLLSKLMPKNLMSLTHKIVIVFVDKGVMEPVLCGLKYKKVVLSWFELIYRKPLNNVFKYIIFIWKAQVSSRFEINNVVSSANKVSWPELSQIVNHL